MASADTVAVTDKLLDYASKFDAREGIHFGGAKILHDLIEKKDPRIFDSMTKHMNDTASAAAEKNEKLDDEIFDSITSELQRGYDDLFSACSTDEGKAISRRERDALGNNKSSLVYGEVSFRSLAIVLNKIRPPSEGVFYDLGSGTGRGVFAAAFLHDFRKCVGIEILPGLAEASRSVLDKFNENPHAFLPPCVSERKMPDISFATGDFLEHDWSDADVVFANSTCFDEVLIRSISTKAEELKPGSYFITLTKKLSSPLFEVVESKQYTMSWGFATVYIQRKRTHPVHSDENGF